MHTYWTALIGHLILLLVNNVHTQQDPLDASFVNSNLFIQGNVPNIFDEDSPYWWMNKGSPFKRSFSQASSLDGGGAAAQSSARMDLSNNPFLSGNSIQQQQQHYDNTFAASNVKPQRLDMTNNPFLSGRPFASLSADTEYSASSINDFSAGTFVAPGYLPPEPAPTVRTPIKCLGNGKVCVEQRICRNGYVDSSLVDNSNQVSVLFILSNLCEECC